MLECLSSLYFIFFLELSVMFQSPWDSGQQRQYSLLEQICWRTRHNQPMLERLSPPVTVFDFVHNGFAPRVERCFSGSREIELLFFVISMFRACEWMRLRPHPQRGSRPFCVNEKHHCPQQTLMTGTKTLTTSTLSNVQALVVSMKSFLWWLICGKSSKFAQYLIHFKRKK